ncbi:hypothetical protein D3C80_1331450 [compost metagenome]
MVGMAPTAVPGRFVGQALALDQGLGLAGLLLGGLACRLALGARGFLALEPLAMLLAGGIAALEAVEFAQRDKTRPGRMPIGRVVVVEGKEGIFEVVGELGVAP